MSLNVDYQVVNLKLKLYYSLLLLVTILVVLLHM